jgi:predicted O-methyltransferase YrrM
MTDHRDEYVTVYTSPRPAETSNASTGRPTPGDLQTVALRTIANTASVLPYWGTFLYLCVRARHAKTILELGGCAGISGCYLAAAPDCRTFITIEGSPALASLAKSNLRQVANNFVVINNLFDTALDELLPSYTDGFDLVHIDGQHEKSSTLHYLERLVPHLQRGSLLAFDDIRWTVDMWETWQLLCARKGMACTIDVGRYGLCLWDGETPSPRNYHFAKFTDLWRKGKPRHERT